MKWFAEKAFWPFVVLYVGLGCTYAFLRLIGIDQDVRKHVLMQLPDTYVTTNVQTQDEQWKTALHEAGHAVAKYVLTGPNGLGSITVNTHVVWEHIWNYRLANLGEADIVMPVRIHDRRSAMQAAPMRLSGEQAGEVVVGQINYSYTDQFDASTDLCKYRGILSTKDLTEEVIASVRADMELARVCATAIAEANKQILHDLAHEVTARPTFYFHRRMNGRDIVEFLSVRNPALPARCVF